MLKKEKEQTIIKIERYDRERVLSARARIFVFYNILHIIIYIYLYVSNYILMMGVKNNTNDKIYI